MTIEALIKGVSVKKIIGDIGREVGSVVFDSRQADSMSLFVAQKGTAIDGHDFIEGCISKGVTAIVCEHFDSDPQGTTVIVVDDSSRALGLIACNFYDNPSKKLTLVGVTGTNGKTTIATLLYKMTRQLGHKSGLLSTVCNYVDGEAIPSTHTTPDAVQLNALLRKMADAGCEYAFMEVSSHSIAQERIAGLQFDGALFTNLTRDHIDYHKTFDNYRDTKKRLFDNLPASAFAVTNKDDKNGMVMTQNCKAGVFTYSTRTVADFHAKILEEGFEGMLLEINRQEVFVPLVGRFNVQNLLCIYGAAVCLGFEPTEILKSLSTLTAVNGRFETIRSPKGWTAVVDYAHTPDAVDNVINTINEIRKQGSQLITVVGCGGNRDKGKRPMMAQIAKHGSDILILTSDNPRDEEPEDILNDMIAGLTEEERLSTIVIADRRQAIRTACTLAKKDDVVLVAGKGHENYQITKGVKHHVDDHEEIMQYNEIK